MSEPSDKGGIIISGGQLERSGNTKDLQGLRQLFPEIKLKSQVDDDLGPFIELSERAVLTLLQKNPEKRHNLIHLLVEEVGNLEAMKNAPRETLERNKDNPRLTAERRSELETTIQKRQERLDRQIRHLQKVKEYVLSLPELEDEPSDTKAAFIRIVSRKD